jgi:hypothetical protein
MERFRQTLRAKRVAVGVIALYALLLQAFFVAPLPAAAFGSLGEIACAQDAPGPGTPARDHTYRHGLCCILGCAACGVASLPASSGVAVFPGRNISAAGWTLTQGIRTPARRNLNFSARGNQHSLFIVSQRRRASAKAPAFALENKS